MTLFTTDSLRPPGSPRPARLRGRLAASLALLLLAFGALVPTGGCGFLQPPPPVADSVEQAFKDGEARETDAVAAEKNRDTSEAADRWNRAATYYGAVANKFKGTDNGLRAVLEQAEALDKGAKNKQGALALLKAATFQYTAAAAPTYYPQLQAAYQDLIRRINEENAQTTQYKVMDTLVRMFGGNPKVSPVLAILFIALAVTLAVWPFRVKQYRSFKEMARFQPELAKLQKKYKENPQELMVKQQQFYKEHGINPYAGCLPMLLQMPITLFMYQVILYYQFHFTQTSFLWINPGSHASSLTFPPPFKGALGGSLGDPDLILLVIYAVSMFLQTKLMPTTPATDPVQVEQQKMMAITMPIVFFVMMLQWQPASAFVLYWLVSNVLGLGQQWIIYRMLPTLPPLSVVSKDDDGGGGGGTAKGNGDGTGAVGAEAKPLAANPKLVSPRNRRKK